jgi:hypothetical protein
MRSTHPPKFAVWLLQHFGSSTNTESLIGDLNEQYGGSRLWYLRQAIVAILVSFFQEISAHKLIAVRALLLGWTVKTAWLLFFKFSFLVSPRYVQDRSLLLASAAGSIVVCAFGAWLVSRISGPLYRPMVLLYIVVELLAVPIMLTVGWYSPFAYPAVLLGAPAEISFLWVAPFAGYCAYTLSRFGFPFESVTSVWCGSILMAVTMLLGGRLLSSPSPSKMPRTVA